MLKEAAEIAAFFLPITALVRLIVQIVAKIYVTRKILRGGDTGGLKWAPLGKAADWLKQGDA